MPRATVRLKWFGGKVLRTIRGDLGRNLHLVGAFLASDIRKTLSKSTRAQGPSPPGAAPHADTGKLRQSIEFEVDERKLVARVGSNLEYAKHLEFGTSKMEARPFLRPAIPKNRRKIIALLTKRKKRGR